ncbi:MAG: hypothetical protein H0T54_04340, partial [Geodermatophilaceae bacterium]|nr:hypothetical protein [Geodermatophilaceae bacterium]
IEDGQMYLDNLRYFNAGTEIRAVASIDQIWMMPESKLSGTATGTARPLANMKLPFLADLDTILTVVQANVTNVAVDGTVHNPKVRPVTFDEIGTDLRAMVLGDAKK